MRHTRPRATARAAADPDLTSAAAFDTVLHQLRSRGSARTAGGSLCDPRRLPAAGAAQASCHDVDVFAVAEVSALTRDDTSGVVERGSRKLAVVASSDGTIIERVPNPAPLKQAQASKALRRLQRKLARSRLANPDGSNRQTELRSMISQAHADVAAVRRDAMHKLTTRLAKTHGVIVIEDLNVEGMTKKSRIPGGKARRRALADAALGEFRRQMTYKCEWYGSELVVASRWFPSSQMCHVCHHRQKIKWAATWTCDGCGSVHDRDDNAAINLAQYEPDPKGGRTPPVVATGRP